MSLNRVETEAERKEASRRRSERYLQLGHDRFAAATLVAQSAGPLNGPAIEQQHYRVAVLRRFSSRSTDRHPAASRGATDTGRH